MITPELKNLDLWDDEIRRIERLSRGRGSDVETMFGRRLSKDDLGLGRSERRTSPPGTPEKPASLSRSIRKLASGRAAYQKAKELMGIGKAPGVTAGEQEMLRVQFMRDKKAKLMPGWEKLCEEFIRDGTWMIKNWKRRKISERTLERCIETFNRPFSPSTVMGGGDARTRWELTRIAGYFTGIGDLCSDEQGEWDRHHFLIQCWGWRACHMWFDKSECKKVSDAAKLVLEMRDKLSDEDKAAWDSWADWAGMPGIDVLATKKRTMIDQKIQWGCGRNIITHLCDRLGLRMPTWDMDGKDVVIDPWLMWVLGLGPEPPGDYGGGQCIG